MPVRARRTLPVGKSVTVFLSIGPSTGGGAWEFNLVGIYHGKRPQDDETQLWFQWDYYEERMVQAY